MDQRVNQTLDFRLQAGLRYVDRARTQSIGGRPRRVEVQVPRQVVRAKSVLVSSSSVGLTRVLPRKIASIRQPPVTWRSKNLYVLELGKTTTLPAWSCPA